MKRKILMALCLMFVMSIPQICLAQNAKSVQALRAIDQGDWTRGRDLVMQSNDPVATKLYYWTFFAEDKSGAHYGQLAQFIRDNPDWPGIRGLRLKFEKTMPDDMRGGDVIAWFDDYAPITVPAMERYLDALIVGGRKAKAKSKANTYWADTLMGRDDQKSFFGKYGAYLTRDAHTKRFDKLLSSEYYTNARAVARVLGQGYPALAEARIALARSDANVSALIASVPQNLQRDTGLQYERVRWRRRNDQDTGAIQLLGQMPNAGGLASAKSWWRERHILARRLIEKKQYRTAYSLVSTHGQKSGLPFAQAEFLSGWLALRFLDEPAKALTHFKTLDAGVKTPISKTRAAYWAGRAAKAMGDKTQAGQWFNKAAKQQTTFYGQLAGGEIGMRSALPNAAPPDVTTQDRTQFEKSDLIKAARILNKAGMRKDAGRFIQQFVDKIDTPKAYVYGAQLSTDLGQDNDALRIAKKASKDGMFLTAQAYPLLVPEMRNVNIEWSLVHAIIRQESMFDIAANSPAGALGLMQLMPGTARDTARKVGLPYNRSALTSKPDYNIRLGSQYLQDMIQRFGGSYPMAIASYNAGPGRTDRWLKTYGDPRTGEIDLIDWIELIPIYETRNYVQRVMEAVYAYRLRLMGKEKSPTASIHVSMK